MYLSRERSLITAKPMQVHLRRFCLFKFLQGLLAMFFEKVEELYSSVKK